MSVAIETVWKKTTPQIRSEIIHFWTINNLLRPGVSPEERAEQVVTISRNEKGQIVALSSADHIQFKQLNNNYFFLFRCVILPDFRIPGLLSKIAVMTRDILEHYAKSMTDHRCIGMLTVVENERLLENRREAVWPATGMVYIGNDPQGRHIRVYYFSGASI